jgi:pyruvate-formate lyase-activating enzyme
LFSQQEYMAKRPIIGFGQPKRKGGEAQQVQVGTPRRAPLGYPDDVPAEAIVRLNIACNQHCFFCNTDARAQNLHETPERVRRYIEENRNALYLSFTGGEPTLNPHILRYIRYAKEQGLRRIIIQTNAMMASYASFADKLVAAGLTGAFVSLHAPSSELSDRITATPGSWEVTLRGLRNLLDRGVEVEMNTVINPMNFAHLGVHARFVAKTFPEIVAISLSFVAPTGFCVASERTIPSIKEVQPHLFEALDVFQQANIPAIIPDRCGIPLCTVRGYEHHHEALMRSPFAGSGILTDDHQKHAGCKRCVWDERCIGYWKDAIAVHGDAALVPVEEEVDVEPIRMPYTNLKTNDISQYWESEKGRLEGAEGSNEEGT